VGPASRAAMGQLLDEIESGAFAREYLAACAAPGGDPRRRAGAGDEAPLARAGHALRARLAALGLDGGSGKE
jgi:hypothetical protein